MDNMTPSLPYPPAHHMLRDLRFCCYATGVDAVVRAPVVAEVFSLAKTGASAGFIATLVDVYAARSGTHAAAPDFVATTSLSFQLSRPLRSTMAAARGRVLRMGTRSLVIEVDIMQTDNNVDVVIGQALVSFARLPPRDAHAPRYPDYDANNVVDLALPDSGLHQHFLQYLGMRVIDAANGVLEVDVREHNTNRLHALQGGAIAWLIESAAEHLLQTQTPAVQWQALDLAVEFISFGKVGPIRTRASCVRSDTRHAVLRVTVHDAGADNRLMSIGTVTLVNINAP